MKQYQTDIRKAVNEEKRKYPKGPPDYIKKSGGWEHMIRMLEAQYRPPMHHSMLRKFIPK